MVSDAQFFLIVADKLYPLRMFVVQNYTLDSVNKDVLHAIRVKN